MAGRTLTLGPFNRVEGDLEITVTMSGGEVTEAYASGMMYRGFEQILRDREPADALVFTPRICGICSCSHSTASANALRALSGVAPPPNGLLARNLILATESGMDHPTHFYLFFAVDLTQPQYADLPEYGELVRRFAPFTGTSYVRAIEERREFLQLLGLLAGKWPHTLAIQPGGTTRPVTASEILQARSIVLRYRRFFEEVLLGGSVDEWLSNRSWKGVEEWLGSGTHAESDLGLFLRVGRAVGLDRMGRGVGRFLAYGCFEQPDGGLWLHGGYDDGGALHPLDEGEVTEHVRHAWFRGPEGGAHPYHGVTEPEPDKPGAYTFCKAPRYNGAPVEVGALARLVVNRDSLVMDLMACFGPCVFVRVLARLQETLRLVVEMERWLGALDPQEPFYADKPLPSEGLAFGRTEAARGALGHWVHIARGRIQNYQIVSPTTWNFSPRDDIEIPGPVEQALLGTAIRNEENPVEIYHIVRSFDPCLVCTVHALRPGRGLRVLRIGGGAA